MVFSGDVRGVGFYGPNPKDKRVNISPRHRVSVVARPRVSEEGTDAAEGRGGELHNIV